MMILFQLSALSVASNHGDCDNILYLFMVDDVHRSIVGASVGWTGQEGCAKAISAATSSVIIQTCCQCVTCASTSKTIQDVPS